MTVSTFGIFNFFVLLGCFQGLLLACIFIFNKKFDKRSNYALALSLISIAFLGIHQILYDLNLKVLYPIVSYIPIRYTILGGITLYYYIVFTMNPNHQYKRKDYLIISPFVFYLLIDVLLFCAYLCNSNFILTHSNIHDFYLNIKELLSILFSFTVLVWAFQLLHQFPIERQYNLTTIEADRLLWFRNNTIAIFIVWSGWAIPEAYSILSGKTFWWLYYPTWLGMVPMIFWLGYFVILKQEYFTGIAPNILSEKTEIHYEKLLQLMHTEKLYKNPDLTLNLLAKKTQLSNGYLSQIINQKGSKNFYEFINTYRVEEVKDNLLDPKYAHYSIFGLALEAGFKSKSTFNSAFKKLTGLTPSAFKNQ